MFLLLHRCLLKGKMHKIIYFVGLKAKHNHRDNVFMDKPLSAKEPIGQFAVWFKEACERKEIIHASAMCLATVSKEGIPSARFVILKNYDENGFMFFTDYRSRKAKEIAENANVAATFYWEVLNRSVRIEGQVEMVSEMESDKYFHAWPVRSQIGASASHMSSPIESRAIVYERMIAIEAECLKLGKPVARPSFWGGYIIRPSVVEFWQGQKDHLSDRIRFRKPKTGEEPDNTILHRGEKGWVYERLSP